MAAVSAVDDDTLENHEYKCGRIDRLEVENFKSYRGHQHIGPFKGFTAVVGPNGSGKSNLMDAISFVLGVRTNQLRGSLKELLYSNSDNNTEEDRPRRGYVKLVYVGEDDGEEVAFARHIVPSSSEPDATYSSVYKINDRTVTWEAYSTKLGSFGILVKIRNFLVFQGDIEAVAAKSPMGLTQLFEQVSGSEALRKSYEELEQARTKAEEKVSLAFSRKKGVAAEKKAKKEQKEEAEKFLARQEELRSLRTELALFQLHGLVGERERLRRQRQRLEREVAEARRQHDTFDEQVEALKRRAAGHAKDRLLAEKNVKKLQAQRDKKSPALIKLKEEIGRVSKRIRLGEKEAEEWKKKADEQRKKIEKLEKELKGVEAAKAEVERESRQRYAEQASADLGGAGVQEEYARIKAQVAEKTAKLQSERDTLASQQRADEDALRSAEQTVTALRTQSATLREQVSDLRARAAASTQAAAAARAEARTKRTERGHVEDSARMANNRRIGLSTKLEELEGQLVEARAERKEAGRDRRMTEAVEAMKRLYPAGVYGRLTDLGKVTQRQYHLALAVAMGREVDSVVVDNERTARECIQYLKDQKVPPMTFIPLASCKVKPVSERLRSLGGSAKLAVDLIEFDPAYERAFLYAFGNTLVCDSTEESRELAYGGSERHKVVSRDGVQFNKAGLITGGGSGSLEDKARRWDEARVEGLKAQREEAARKLRELPSASELRERELALNQEIEAAESTVRFKEAEAVMAEERAAKSEADASRLEAEAGVRQPEVDRLRGQIEAREEQIQALTDRINTVADKLFEPFSRRLGIASIRQYEEQHAAFEEKAASQRSMLAAQEAKIRSQLQYERGRDLAGPLSRREAENAKDAAELSRLEGQQAEAAGALADVDKQIAAAMEKVNAAKIEVEKAETDLRDLKGRGSGASGQLVRLSREAAGVEAKLEQLEVAAKDVVTGAELEQVPIPRKAGSGRKRRGGKQQQGDDGEEDEEESDEEGGEEQQGGGASRKRQRRRTADGAQGEAMEVDEEEGEGEEGGAGPTTSVLDTIDFTSLKRNLSQITSAKERDATEKDLQKQVSELSAELASRAPNMKAVEQYAAVKEREKEMGAALEEARREAAEATDKFNKTRQRRYDLFMRAFEHIAREIDVIYKDLTRSNVHPLGGTAYLSLENNDEPFLHGIKYTAMPPTKRFRDMEQLSGGEKTVAALALLFAIHSHRPSPFFVLDEVDAALDATNVSRVAHYIRDRTRDEAQGKFQSIVISLKDIFYEKADALVGVARDVDAGCSRTFTFDLNRFEPPTRD